MTEESALKVPPLIRKFQLVTDHASLQWLSAQKMEGMLCRWALAMQEFSFDISYRKGSLNGYADALSCRIDSGEVDTAAVTTTEVSLAEIRAAQQGEEVSGKIYRSQSSLRVQPSSKEQQSISPLSTVMVTVGSCRWSCVQTVQT